jgi:hypothetical protein
VPFFFRLCITICKTVHSTRLSGNKDFGLAQHLTTTFAPKWAELRVRCGNDAPWDLWRRSLPRICCPSHEAWKPATNAGFHIPTATAATVSDLAGKPTPLKLRALSDSCTEPFFQLIGFKSLQLQLHFSDRNRISNTSRPFTISEHPYEVCLRQPFRRELLLTIRIFPCTIYCSFTFDSGKISR